MSSLFTLEQLQWIHEHATLLGVISTFLIIGGLCLLAIWIDGGIDDSMADPILYVPGDD